MHSGQSIVTFLYKTAGCLLFKMYTGCLMFSKHRVGGMHIDKLMLLYAWKIVISITKATAESCSKMNWRKYVHYPRSSNAAIKMVTVLRGLQTEVLRMVVILRNFSVLEWHGIGIFQSPKLGWTQMDWAVNKAGLHFEHSLKYTSIRLHYHLQNVFLVQLSLSAPF